MDETDTKAGNLLPRIMQTVEQNEREIKKMNTRLEKIEHAIKITGVNMTVGQTVLANRKTLVRTLNLLSNKPDSEELKEMVQDQEQKLVERLERCKMDLASNFQKANEAIGALVARIEVISDDVRNKVDISSFKVLSSEAAALKNYAEFVKQTEIALKDLKESFSAVKLTVEDQGNKTKSLSDQTKQILLELSKYASYNDLDDVMNKIDSFSRSVESKVDMQEYSTLLNKSASIEKDVKSDKENIKTLFTSHETLAKYLTKRLEETYLKSALDQEISKFLRKDVFVGEIERLDEKIDSKANFQALRQVNQALEAFQRDMNVTKKKADLAAQFIALSDKR